MVNFIRLGMKKLHYTELKSHPNKYLEDHLENVANFSKSSFSSLEFEYNILFSEISYLIGLSHDFAKSTSFFQNYLINNIKSENTQHSFLSAIFTYFVVDEYLKDKNIVFDKNLSIISYIVVLYHHGNIKNIPYLDEYHDKKVGYKLIKNQIHDLENVDTKLYSFYSEKNICLDNFFDYFDEICEKISDDLFDFQYDETFDNYFYILLFYSVLLDADKMDASQSKFIDRKQIPNNLINDYKKTHLFNLDGINKIHEDAFIEVNNNIEDLDLSNKIYSINLPTGIGKTLTGFSAVLKLKDRISKELNINPRIIYSLPFLSVIDQNEDIIRDIFNKNDLIGSNFLLKHNHLAEMQYLDYDNQEVYDISNSKILIEGWNSEVIITTFIQFFYSLIGNKNSFLRKFHNIANSIILLDEIQSIPYKYWGIINSLLRKLADEYNCWIILMTATQPLIFKENEIISLVNDVEYYFNQFDRVDYNFQLDGLLIDEFCDDFIEIIEKNKSDNIMVVLNTIDSSKIVYETVKQYYSNTGQKLSVDDIGICHVGNDINLIYLSSNIVPFHRLNKINLIKNSNKQNIIISTQLIEAGVDIDVDIVYRDFAPLDSIIQTAGRCNRSGKKNKGVVNVISLKNDNGKYYSSFVYQNLLLTTTNEVLNNISRISEKEFNLSASLNYFKLISQRNFDDDKLKNIINNLRFDEISSNFKLISNSNQKIDVFICINQEAEGIFNEYKRIVEDLNGFNRQNAFLNIKNKFYKYVISVDEKKFGSANLYNDEIGIVFLEDLDSKYKLDLGFIFSENEEPMIW